MKKRTQKTVSETISIADAVKAKTIKELEQTVTECRDDLAKLKIRMSERQDTLSSALNHLYDLEPNPVGGRH